MRYRISTYILCNLYNLYQPTSYTRYRISTYILHNIQDINMNIKYMKSLRYSSKMLWIQKWLWWFRKFWNTRNMSDREVYWEKTFQTKCKFVNISALNLKMPLNISKYIFGSRECRSRKVLRSIWKSWVNVWMQPLWIWKELRWFGKASGTLEASFETKREQWRDIWDLIFKARPLFLSRITDQAQQGQN